jgi:hypothetical protein
MWTAVQKILTPNQTEHYALFENQTPLPAADVFTLWANNPTFRDFFTNLLAAAPFNAYKWETPPVTTDTLTRSFEFVLINTPALNREPDPRSFADQFKADKSNHSVIAFPSLGGDATMIVPRPQADAKTYTHLASFLREAPASQRHELWSTIATQTNAQINANPIWLSTAGMGVPWLHVRLDTRPKYYGHQPYARH